MLDNLLEMAPVLELVGVTWSLLGCVLAGGWLKWKDLGGLAGGADLITETPLTPGSGTAGSEDGVSVAGLGTGVWTPEKSPTTPQCVLPSSKDSPGSGDVGAGGRSTVGGVSLLMFNLLGGAGLVILT